MTVGGIDPVAQKGFDTAAATNIAIGVNERSGLNDLSTNLALITSEGTSLAGVTFQSAAPEQFSGLRVDNFVLQSSFTAGKNQNLASFENSSGFEGKSLGNLGADLSFQRQELFSGLNVSNFVIQDSFTDTNLSGNLASFENSSSAGGKTLGNLGGDLSFQKQELFSGLNVSNFVIQESFTNTGLSGNLASFDRSAQGGSTTLGNLINKMI